VTIVRPIGSVLPIDTEGYLLNPCHRDLIVSPWKEAVVDIAAAYIDHLGETAIHSLYLRGSVAKGTAVEGISDIDTFAVVNKKGTNCDKTWRKAFQKQMSEKYPFQTGIEIWCIPYQELCHEPKAHSLRVMVKTQCICLHGEDIASQLLTYKPGKDFIVHSHSIQADIQEILDLLQTQQSQQDILSACQWIMKRIVRTGFEWVMIQENTYTRDLYPCYVAFRKHFPERKEQMAQAVEWAIAPTSNPQSLIPFLTNFQSWFAQA